MGQTTNKPSAPLFAIRLKTFMWLQPRETEMAATSSQTAWSSLRNSVTKALKNFRTYIAAKGKYHKGVFAHYIPKQNKNKETNKTQPDKGRLKKKEMQYKMQSQLQHFSSHSAKGNILEKANGNSLAKQALQCFVQMLLQLLGHFFPQMSQAVFYWALWIGRAEHWGSVAVKPCGGKCWEKKVHRIKQIHRRTSTVSDSLS